MNQGIEVCTYGSFKKLSVVMQGCALAEPDRLRQLTFGIGRQGNIFLLARSGTLVRSPVCNKETKVYISVGSLS